MKQDKDLAFLATCENEDLRTLCDILTYNNKGELRLSEQLTNSDAYINCYPEQMNAMAEAYFDNKQRDANVNVRRSKKTSEAFSRLADEFTTEDVMRVFNLNSSGSARMKISRLLKDHLIERIGEFKEGPFKGCFRKTGIMLS